MSEPSKKKSRKFVVIGTIFIILLLITIGSPIILNIIIDIFLISQSKMSTEIIFKILFYVFAVVFIAICAFFAVRAIKKHELNADLAENTAREYEETSNDETENK